MTKWRSVDSLACMDDGIMEMTIGYIYGIKKYIYNFNMILANVSLYRRSSTCGLYSCFISLMNLIFFILLYLSVYIRTFDNCQCYVNNKDILQILFLRKKECLRVL
jgi:hypothetical protein